MKRDYIQPTLRVQYLHSGLLLQTLSSPDIKPGEGEIPGEADSKHRYDNGWGNLW